MNSPYISIIMPVYNCEEYLCQSINSVIEQTFTDIELVCVDDNSTDNSMAIMQGYAQKDNRLKIVRHYKNLGEMPSRGDGVMAASGRYIMFLDSDDELAHDACEKLYDAALNQQADIYGFKTQVCCPDEKVRVDVQNYFTSYNGRLYGADILQKSFIDHVFTRNLWDKMYDAHLCKRAFSQIASDYQDQAWFTMAEDSLAFLYIAYNAESFYGINDELYKYYYGRGIMQKGILSLDHFRKYCTLALTSDRIEAFLDKQGKPAQYKDIANAFRMEQLNVCMDALIYQITDDDFFYAAGVMKSFWSSIGPLDIMIRLAERYRSETASLGREIDRLENEKSWVAPFSLLPGKGQIILYGAGDVGKDYYRQITDSGYCDIALWVDRGYMSMREAGLPVHAPEKITGIYYDCVLIAVWDNEIAKKIKKSLVDLGVDGSKVIWRVLPGTKDE